MCNCRDGRLTCTDRRCPRSAVLTGTRRRRSHEDEDESSKFVRSKSGTRKSGKSRGRTPGPITSDDPCYGCWDEPPYPVCAPDGHTYISECFAVHCGGRNAEDLLLGPCSNYVRLPFSQLSFSELCGLILSPFVIFNSTCTICF